MNRSPSLSPALRQALKDCDARGDCDREDDPGFDIDAALDAFQAAVKTLKQARKRCCHPNPPPKKTAEKTASKTAPKSGATETRAHAFRRAHVRRTRRNRLARAGAPAAPARVVARRTPRTARRRAPRRRAGRAEARRPGQRGAAGAAPPRDAAARRAPPARPRPPPRWSRRPAWPPRSLLDGILEIRVGRRFVRGGAALARYELSEHDGGAARLAAAALRHGSALAAQGTLAVAELLYRYHTSPRPPWWRNRFPSRTVGRRVPPPRRAGDAPRPRARVARGGRAARPERLARVARARRGAPRPAAPAAQGVRQVRPNALPDAFAITLGTLAAVPGAAHVKVACTVDGPLRPDHLVVISPRPRTLRAVVPALERDLAGLPGHGVPFAAALTPDGLLSWGVDPARRPAPRGGATSWRAWLALRLAGFLTAAAACGPSPIAPHLVALARLPALAWIRTPGSQDRTSGRRRRAARERAPAIRAGARRRDPRCRGRFPPASAASWRCRSRELVLSRVYGRTAPCLVDARVAPLLDRFRRPTSLADALRGEHDAVPVLARLVARGYLVLAGEVDAAPVTAMLRPGDRLDRFVVRRCVHLLEDCEVHRGAGRRRRARRAQARARPTRAPRPPACAARRRCCGASAARPRRGVSASAPPTDARGSP